jgi:hypothetical protein
MCLLLSHFIIESIILAARQLDTIFSELTDLEVQPKEEIL